MGELLAFEVVLLHQNSATRAPCTWRSLPLSMPSTISDLFGKSLIWSRKCDSGGSTLQVKCCQSVDTRDVLSPSGNPSSTKSLSRPVSQFLMNNSMAFATRISSSWVSMKLDKSFVSFRSTIFRAVITVLVFVLLAYLLLWVPIFHFLGAFNGIPSHRGPTIVVEAGEE